ncbi:hypothetical protein AJ78_07007 [Emergomyces pasteurianus Ep9510]|uniref:FAS1 domain-containing protein n=1 Tax=Emergomyces pasteurianus Ep9510 TaxID=1447872 RepID=A0A1J9P8G8_9EURO|nr:hypothetical protein AJ78_07007 [Emergomyces pasteurianus Ep9510]
MKTTFTLLVASVVEAIIIPNQQQFSALTEILPHLRHENLPRPSDFTQFQEDEASFVRHITELNEMTENIDWLMANHPHEAESSAILPSDQDDDDIEYGDQWDDGWDEDSSIQPQFQTLHVGGHHPGHGHFNMTLYEMINASTHTKTFAKLVSKFDDIVEILNSTSSKHTVFVPTDKAFAKFKHHTRVPDEILKRLIMYHIAPHEYSRRDVFSLRTIPTSLERADLGPYPQRICTQFGLKGLTLNFYASIVKSNLYGTNGVAHGLNHILFPPFPAADTLNFLPSTFSTFQLGLYKTGLIDNVNDTSTHSGATFFVPTNRAFKKLGRRLNALLFSRWGEKYLKALLKYHIVYDHTLYSDAYNKPEDDKGLNHQSFHVDLPTLLSQRHLSIDIARYNRFVTFKINGFTSVTVPDLVTRDGVIHVLNKVLIPPCQPHRQAPKDIGPTTQHPLLSDEENTFSDLTIEDIIGRLEPYVEN